MSDPLASSNPVPLTDVRGGSHGLAVGYEQARALASSYDGAGNRLRDWAGTGGRVLCNGDLLESALLSPRLVRRGRAGRARGDDRSRRRPGRVGRLGDRRRC